MNKEQKRQAELIKEMIRTFKVDLATNIQEKVALKFCFVLRTNIV